MQTKKAKSRVSSVFWWKAVIILTLSGIVLFLWPESLRARQPDPESQAKPADSALKDAGAAGKKQAATAVSLLSESGLTMGPARSNSGRETMNSPENSSPAPLSAAQVNPPAATPSGAAIYQVAPSGSKIKIDGLLNEEAWQTAAVIPLLYEWTPGDNIEPPVKTECLVTYDHNNLYVAFRCYDPESRKIRAHLMDRDDTDKLILDDHVSFMLDCFNDERRGFQFRVNPLGVQADANFSELEGYEDFSWDAIWNSAGRIEDWGYAVEVAIPFNQLRFRASDTPQTWGFSAERSWPRGVRHRITSHRRSRSVSCILCQFNKLVGFAGISPGRNIEINPTLTAVRTEAMDPDTFPDGSLEKLNQKVDPGLTLKWGVTPNLILNATANPDFSQVEADVAQLEINRRFALYYPEKRPFFLEGGDFFLTPINAVFTRTVADPVWGMKMTGKIGRTALGFFSAQDEINNLLLPGSQGSMSLSLDDRVYGGVFRLRQDIGQGSTLGLLYTGRVGSDYHNHLFGADGFLRLNRTTSLTVQFLRSETAYPDIVSDLYGQPAGSLGGNAINLNLMHQSRNWIIQGILEDLGRNFRADYGYVPRVDTRSAGAVVMRQIWGDRKSWFDVIRIGVMGQLIYDHDGKALDKGLTFRTMYQGPLQTSITLSGNFGQTLYIDQTLSYALFDGELGIKPFSGSEFRLEAAAGRWIDFDNIRPADMVSLEPGFSLNLTRHLNLTTSYNYEQLKAEGEQIYIANLLQAKLIYNFNVKAFIRAIIQYRDIDRNLDAYSFPVQPETRGLFTQFLFSYKLNPRTVLFLGYTDNSLGLENISLTRTTRTFFLKIGYAWQL
ncbi:MAG: DUF5916 domain-containing protein [Candidatus Saccharicenans sp.]|nr:DUF5916 domain-containing protein [Candidatus Saccharicenans sp.]